MTVTKNIPYDECAATVKELLQDNGLEVREEKNTGQNYQFRIYRDDTSLGHLRFYQSNHGTTIDFSQLNAGQEHIRDVLDDYIDLPKTDETMVANLTSYNVIGTDESGKGDFFGPLVIAAVYIPDEATVEELQRIGVADSKNVSDSKVFDQSQVIRQHCHVATVDLPPETYNRLYDDIGNLNRLMGWAHARAIEDLLEDGVKPEAVLSDKFGDESYIKDKLMENGEGTDVVQETKAERHIAVAAASIIARNAFLQSLVNLATKYRVNLPKGAGKQVVEAGKEFVAQHGTDALEQVGKMHFKTAKKILN